MTTPTPSAPVHHAESLQSAMARWASHASPRLLLDMFAFGLALAAVLIAVNWRLPFGIACLAASGVGAWGLLTQFPSTAHPFRHRVLCVASALVAMLAGIATVVETLFWAMGPAPRL